MISLFDFRRSIMADVRLFFAAIHSLQFSVTISNRAVVGAMLLSGAISVGTKIQLERVVLRIYFD
ncbi:MAG: hypothetical protein LBJ00_03880 [Planctomycetaceae bacterium]|nr:hypothetical protein [Planctomycetaceae bacterium]